MTKFSLQSMAPKWSWSCRAMNRTEPFSLRFHDRANPRVGDIALVKVKSLGQHSRIQTATNERLRLYPGDQLIGVFGHRYATDAFEAEVDSIDPLHLLTAAGMIGTVQSRHSSTKSPTRLDFLGYLANDKGERLNLKASCYRSSSVMEVPENVVFLVGTGMNSGKTTTAAVLVKDLLEQGLRVAACKLTGSVSHRDAFEYRATGAHDVRDFSDYGLPSTYLCSPQELRQLFQVMMADAASSSPDIVVVEIADGVLQRETQFLLSDQQIRQFVNCVILTATCATSALYGIEQIEAYGHTVTAVSGLITNSPLFVREFANHSDIPVVASIGANGAIADFVTQNLGVRA